ncbi:MEDS domain-containing protein [Kitasatospora sp. NPDC088346]|uniref:MEDS domain-containing protein n=1 Tax=Kitasatospora sp. NPDC088346 TaxID=3364073 RepID=UPI00381C6B44
MTHTVDAPPDAGLFEHSALFHRTPQEYVCAVGDFVRAAVQADEPAFVAVPADRLEHLGEWLGTDGNGDGAEFADTAVPGRNPGRIPAALQGFADRHPGRAARILGEPVRAGRSRAEVLEVIRHEALVTTAFAGRAATVRCPYDVTALPVEAVAGARRTRPTPVEDGRDLASGRGGRGLWMIHQPCDPVEVRAAEDGLTLRLRLGP